MVAVRSSCATIEAVKKSADRRRARRQVRRSIFRVLPMRILALRSPANFGYRSRSTCASSYTPSLNERRRRRRVATRTLSGVALRNNLVGFTPKPSRLAIHEEFLRRRKHVRIGFEGRPFRTRFLPTTPCQRDGSLSDSDSLLQAPLWNANRQFGAPKSRKKRISHCLPRARGARLGYRGHNEQAF